MRIQNIPGVIVIAAVAACSVLESNGGPRVSVTADVAPLEVALGDTVRINISVRNTSDRDISIAPGGCNSNFLISDMDGNAYNQAELVVCTLDLKAPIMLAPGTSHAIHAFTTGRAIREGSQGEAGYLPKGRYRLRPMIPVLSGGEQYVLVTADPAYVTFR